MCCSWRWVSYSEKTTFLEIVDMIFTGVVLFSKHLDICSQYLVTHLVPGVKGLPGGVDLVCHAGLDPPAPRDDY